MKNDPAIMQKPSLPFTFLMKSPRVELKKKVKTSFSIFSNEQILTLVDGLVTARGVISVPKGFCSMVAAVIAFYFGGG